MGKGANLSDLYFGLDYIGRFIKKGYPCKPEQMTEKRLERLLAASLNLTGLLNNKGWKVIPQYRRGRYDIRIRGSNNFYIEIKDIRPNTYKFRIGDKLIKQLQRLGRHRGTGVLVFVCYTKENLKKHDLVITMMKKLCDQHGVTFLTYPWHRLSSIQVSHKGSRRI